MGCGKKLIGISKPESSSISQNLARISARMDCSGMAQVPIMKLIAPIKKKLPSTLTTNNEKFSRDEGPFTGNTSAHTIATGPVSSPRRKADSPMAREIHIHCIETGLIRGHGNVL